MAERRAHWSYQPLKRPAIPKVKDADWVRTPVDAFVLAGLERVVQLADIDARDAAQRDRLKKLADDAKKLREKLRNGVERRDAQAELGRLREAITAERLSLGEGDQRQCCGIHAVSRGCAGGKGHPRARTSGTGAAQIWDPKRGRSTLSAVTSPSAPS